MCIISLCSLIFLVITAIVAAIGFFSGLTVLVGICLLAALCILCGAGLLIKLLAKGAFSLLKCVTLVILLAVPVINVFALAVICIAAVKMISSSNDKNVIR